MPHSLLDNADLPALRAAVAEGPEAALAAALIDTGLLQFDPDDPSWEDRDRLFVAGRDLPAALAARLRQAGADPGVVLRTLRTGGDALALAFGAAVAAEADGGAWRAWCLLDDEATDDGRVWEVARAAAQAGSPTLAALVTGAETAALWRACGWPVHEAPADDPVWLLSALDQVVAGAPAALLVATDA
jgi:transketolase N-terminal domain/subunit